MRPIAEGFTDKLKASILLSDVFRHYGIEVKKQGKDFVCLSPFREERTPSLGIDDRKGLWIDRGDTNNKGDAITFIQLHDGVEYPQAVESLAQIANIPMEYKPMSENAQRWQAKSNMLFKVNAWAVEQFQKGLLESGEGVDYICNQRQITPDTIKEFGVGFTPGGFRYIRSLASNEQINALVDADLLIRKINDNGKKTLYDKFFGAERIMFPIKNTQGKVVAFGGRKLDTNDDPKAPKYTNTAETNIYKKGNELYGLYETLSKNKNAPEKIVIVEGYIDVLSMHQNGIGVAVSSNGTALTPEQVSKAFRYTDHVQFCFDGDSAGFKAAEKAMDTAMPFLEDGKSASFVLLPQGHDADSILRGHGAEVMQDILNKAVSVADFTMVRAKFGLDMQSEKDISIAAQRIVFMVSRMPIGLMRDRTATVVGEQLNINPQQLLKTIDRVSDQRMKEEKERELKRESYKQQPSAKNTTPTNNNATIGGVNTGLTQQTADGQSKKKPAPPMMKNSF